MTALSREGLLKKDITSFFCDLVRDMAPARQDLKVTYEQGFFLLETTDDKFDISWFSRVKMLEL